MILIFKIKTNIFKLQKLNILKFLILELDLKKKKKRRNKKNKTFLNPKPTIAVQMKMYEVFKRV